MLASAPVAAADVTCVVSSANVGAPPSSSARQSNADSMRSFILFFILFYTSESWHNSPSYAHYNIMPGFSQAHSWT